MLNDIISKILVIDESTIKDELSRADVEEWDSMTHLILISEIEQNFNVMFNDDDIASIQTIGDIKKILEKENVKY
jgi:acyl carrier protein